MLKFSEILSEIKMIPATPLNRAMQDKEYCQDLANAMGYDYKVYGDIEGLFENYIDPKNQEDFNQYRLTEEDMRKFFQYVELNYEINEEYWDDIEDNDDEELDETSTTGGGVAGASFTPGAGEQYATPKAFGKNKKYKVFGYKDVPKNTRFKAKTFDVANWKNNKSRYLREELGYGDDLAGQIISTSIKRFQEIESIIQKTKNKLLATNIGEILDDPQQLRLIQESLERISELSDKTKSKLDDVADTFIDRDVADWDSYNKITKVSDIGSELYNKISATQFIVDGLLDIYDKLAEDKEHLFKAFNRI